VAVKDADVEVVDEDGALGAGASLAQADAVPCGGPPLVVRGAPPMAAMKRTVCPDRTSWGVPLMGCGSPEIVEGFLCRFRLGLGFPDLVVDG